MRMVSLRGGVSGELRQRATNDARLRGSPITLSECGNCFVLGMKRSLRQEARIARYLDQDLHGKREAEVC